jgi:hypothetical protein
MPAISTKAIEDGPPDELAGLQSRRKRRPILPEGFHTATLTTIGTALTNNDDRYSIIAMVSHEPGRTAAIGGDECTHAADGDLLAQAIPPSR